jgi:hypothetical protein
VTSLFTDGYDHYGTGTGAATLMLEGPYAAAPIDGGSNANVGPIAVPPWGVPHGLYALFDEGAQLAWRRVIPQGPQNKVFVSLRFSISSIPASSVIGGLIDFRDSNNNVMATLMVSPSGALQLKQAGPGGAVIAATQGPVIVAANWHFLEMEFDYGGDAFTLRVDDAEGTGAPAIAATGLTWATNISATAQFGLMPIPTGVNTNLINTYIKDIWVRNDQGTVNNGFQGDFSVATLWPDGDDATEANWTPSYRQKIGLGIFDNTGPVQNFTNQPPAISMPAATSTDLGTGDFTIESFVRFNTLPTGGNKAVIMGKWDESHNKRSWQLYLGGPTLESGNLVFRISTDGTAATVAEIISYPWVADTDTWHHFAVVRASGETLLFIDGVQLGLPVADTNAYFGGGTELLAIGAQVELGAPNAPIAFTGYSGWLDETRLTVGFARYTSAFTPTTVPLPRGAIADPEWADVAFLAGYDSGLADESSFLRPITIYQGATTATPDDGPLIGAFSTINKVQPADDTFLAAPFLAATDILTVNGGAISNNETVTVGLTNTAAPAVYTWKTALTGAAYEVLIDTSEVQALQNLMNAINQGPGIGTKYGTGTIANASVLASTLPATQLEVQALIAGSAGNSIAATETMAHGAWASATLAGGADIPGPSQFHMQRPPPDTTLIYALHTVTREYKTDAGPGSVKTSLIGALGGVADGPVHALTTSPVYYEDVHETDPDSGNAITPSTIVGGRIRFTRTA